MNKRIKRKKYFKREDIIFTSAQDLHTRLRVGRSVIRDGKKVIIWEKLYPENAELFWRKYEVGLLTMREIFHIYGLRIVWEDDNETVYAYVRE